ncbi:MAG: AMMECR1 domain-containing protein [Bacteroidales bacterium]|jgi:AMMECR1 domain-containing protein|nr:AMMECR1 domain-containing protein [Bacteroidales bacterium]
MFHAKTKYAKIAFETILFYVSTGEIKKKERAKISPDLRLKRACVVSIFDNENNLRGRKGSIFPQTSTLYEEIIKNSIDAAVHDNDFKPLTNNDLNSIKVKVDVLSTPQRVESFEDIKPQKHGLYVTGPEGQKGFILPGTKGIKTTGQFLEAAKNAAGITQEGNKNLEYSFFKIASYE